ncbi:hypothetical protein NDU88_005406 [Pleurodeles waltl]|uniref:Uncharacterized protein n=1 Tax=Pleurodeles waltl TaxID=8319 RepID=A0AAV7L9D1_PLEWA|nr:hypothetical protein NDU88_005406 [Pleurodeles waltl]
MATAQAGPSSQQNRTPPVVGPGRGFLTEESAQALSLETLQFSHLCMRSGKTRQYQFTQHPSRALRPRATSSALIACTRSRGVRCARRSLGPSLRVAP